MRVTSPGAVRAPMKTPVGWGLKPAPTGVVLAALTYGTGTVVTVSLTRGSGGGIVLVGSGDIVAVASGGVVAVGSGRGSVGTLVGTGLGVPRSGVSVGPGVPMV